MSDDFAKCGCCVQERRPLRANASELEKLVFEIERIKAAPEKTTSSPPRELV